jgi:hypothetical protein
MLVDHYENFSISNHWAVKCDSLFNTLVREGVLIKGTWEKRRRIGFHTVLALGDAFLQSGLDEGCLSWDILLSKQLSVVLIAACACRVGDISRTVLYTGTEYLTFKDIVLSFGSGDQPNDLSMDVTLRAVKGFKYVFKHAGIDTVDSLILRAKSLTTLPRNVLNEDRYIHIAALQDSKHNSVCPVKLLVIHALRTGAVDPSSWEDLTAQTLRRRDRTVQWKTPDRPVISAIVPGKCSFLDLEKPARTGQIMNTLVNMGRKAKLVVKATTHDLRRGSVKDISHLKEDVRGFATPTVAAAVGHRVSTYMNDVTASYNGGSDVSIWTLRAESGFKDRQAPMLADSLFVARKPEKHEAQTYCAAQGWDAEDPHALRNAKRRLVEDQENTWRIASKNADVSADTLPHKKRFTTSKQ